MLSVNFYQVIISFLVEILFYCIEKLLIFPPVIDFMVQVLVLILDNGQSLLDNKYINSPFLLLTLFYFLLLWLSIQLYLFCLYFLLTCLIVSSLDILFCLFLF